MLQLHQVSPASYPQQQLHMDTQGKAKPGQYFFLTVSNHGFPEGQLSTKNTQAKQGPDGCTLDGWSSSISQLLFPTDTKENFLQGPDLHEG